MEGKATESKMTIGLHWVIHRRSEGGAWGGIHTQIFLLYVYALLWKYAFKLIHCPCFSFFLFCCFYDFQISRDIFGFVLFSVMVSWDYFYNAHFLVSRNSFFFFLFQITLKTVNWINFKDLIGFIQRFDSQIQQLKRQFKVLYKMEDFYKQKEWRIKERREVIPAKTCFCQGQLPLGQ